MGHGTRSHKADHNKIVFLLESLPTSVKGYANGMQAAHSVLGQPLSIVLYPDYPFSLFEYLCNSLIMHCWQVADVLLDLANEGKIYERHLKRQEKNAQKSITKWVQGRYC